MKICKNCGYAADDSQLRCPKCGDLFAEDMDNMLRAMKSNLNNYKNEVSAAPVQPQAPAAPVQPQASAAPVSPAPQAAQSVQPAAQAYVPVQQQAAYRPVQPVQPVQPAQPAPASRGEEYELKAELAQVKGELRALQGEMDRVSGGRGGYGQPQMPVIVQPVSAAQPLPPQPTVIYQTYPQAAPAQAPAAGKSAEAAKNAKYKPGKRRPAKIRRCGSRIFIAIVVLLMIGLSIAMFFFDWVDGMFSGFDIIAALGGNENGAMFELYVSTFITADQLWFGGVATACEYILRYGVIVYAVLLLLGLPVLFSLGGRVKFKGWHTFCAWASFICALLFFIIFWLASGFSSMTIWFLLGAGANFVRCIFLLFYKGYDHEVDITFRKETKID